MEDRLVFLTNYARTGYPYGKKMNLNTYLSPYRKLFLKWDIDLNEKVEIIKLLKENIEEYLYDLSGRKYFLERTQNVTKGREI